MALATYSDFQTRTANGRNTMAWSNTQDRTAPFPLEKYSIFPDYATACAYAAGEGEYEGLPYEGQIISVTENGKQVVYALDRNATNYLRKVASDVDPETLEPSDIGAADKDHTHKISDITNLEARLQSIESSSGTGGSITYTVNGKSAVDGNFTINAEDLNAAPAVHTHSISDVTSLQTVLEQKSDTEHTHTMVTGITVNDQTLTGEITIDGSDNVDVQQNGSNINISLTPYETDCTNSIVDASNANKSYQIFVGTDAEWNEFKQTINDSTNYLVFIRS